MKMRKSAKDRKAEILQATMDIAFEIGPDRLSTGMIADRLGLTQPALYKHFNNKEDIWQAVAIKLYDLIAGNIEAASSTSLTPVARVRQLVIGHLHLVQDHPALPQIMIMRDPSGGRTPSLAPVWAGVTEFRKVLATIVDEARASGQFRSDIDAIDAASLIFGIIQGLAIRLLLSRDPEILIRDGERLLDLQLSLFAANGKRI